MGERGRVVHTRGGAGILLWRAVPHTQSGHQGLMIGERAAVVRVMARGGFESLAGDAESGNSLGQVKGTERLLWQVLFFQENLLPVLPFSTYPIHGPAPAEAHHRG